MKANEASEYCSPSIYVPKLHNISKPCLVIDFTKPNEKVLYPVDPMIYPNLVWWGVPVSWNISSDLIDHASTGISQLLSPVRHYWHSWVQLTMGLVAITGIGCQWDSAWPAPSSTIWSRRHWPRNQASTTWWKWWTMSSCMPKTLTELLEQLKLFLKVCSNHTLMVPLKKLPGAKV